MGRYGIMGMLSRGGKVGYERKRDTIPMIYKEGKRVEESRKECDRIKQKSRSRTKAPTY